MFEYTELEGKEVKDMKILLLVASITFAVLTLVSIGFVLFGQFNASLAVVPMVFAITCITTYQRKYPFKATSN